MTFLGSLGLGRSSQARILPHPSAISHNLPGPPPPSPNISCLLSHPPQPPSSSCVFSHPHLTLCITGEMLAHYAPPAAGISPPPHLVHYRRDVGPLRPPRRWYLRPPLHRYRALLRHPGATSPRISPSTPSPAFTPPAWRPSAPSTAFSPLLLTPSSHPFFTARRPLLRLPRRGTC